MTRVKFVSREKYINFRDKAEEFYRAMRYSYEQGDYTAAVALATHCAISYVDALTVFKLGKKSSGQGHTEAIILLKDTQTSNEAEKARMSQKLYELIEMKTPAEYEDIKMSKADAERAKNLCEKIIAFLREELKRSELLSS